MSGRVCDARGGKARGGGSAAERQLEPREAGAQVLAPLQPHRPAVDLRDVADDGEAEAGAGLAGVEPGAAVEDALALLLGDAAAVVLDLDLDALGVGLPRHKARAAAIFGGVLDEVAEHLVQILALDPDRGRLV